MPLSSDLLVFSTVWAYRIEGIVSAQHVDLYRRYVKEDEAISQLRRAVWLAGNDVRDFFLSSQPDRTQQLKAQVQDLEARSSAAIEELERGKPDEVGTRFLKAHLREYWRKTAACT